MQNGCLLSVTMVLGLATGTLFATDKGVYGEDDRREVFDQENELSMRNLARSTAAVVDVRNILIQGQSRYKLVSDSHGSRENLCYDEPFFEQPSAAHCSSFLVGPDLVLSAGHCFVDFGACESSAFVFDYSYYNKLDQPELVEDSQIYTCKEILDVGVDNETGLDFAIVRLNRRVADRTPLVLNQNNDIETGDQITVIGNPSGLPTKIAGGAKVRQSAHPVWFMTNLDTFHGNSGSAVFNNATKKVEGILVRGDVDFEYDELHGCTRVKRCRDDGCQGEAVTKISSFYNKLATFF